MKGLHVTPLPTLPTLSAHLTLSTPLSALSVLLTLPYSPHTLSVLLTLSSRRSSRSRKKFDMFLKKTIEDRDASARTLYR